jgi:hypothetical protein
MHLLEKFWAKVTTFSAIFSFSAVQDGGQAPLVIPNHDALTLHGQDGPVFHPPGIPYDSSFKCEYPAMEGWESCSTPYDRKCWLRQTSTGKQFDINTNYEEEMPIGITRYYNLILEDSWFSADGLNFTAAKLFREEGAPENQYPGPWIEACWGDRYAALPIPYRFGDEVLQLIEKIFKRRSQCDK